METSSVEFYLFQSSFENTRGLAVCIVRASLFYHQGDSTAKSPDANLSCVLKGTGGIQAILADLKDSTYGSGFQRCRRVHFGRCRHALMILRLWSRGVNLRILKTFCIGLL